MGERRKRRVVRGFLQSFSEKSAANLRGSSLEAYPSQASPLNVTAARGKWFTCSGETPWRLLPVCCTQKQLEGEKSGEDVEMSVHVITLLMRVPQKSGVRATANFLGGANGG